MIDNYKSVRTGGEREEAKVSESEKEFSLSSDKGAEQQ